MDLLKMLAKMFPGALMAYFELAFNKDETRWLFAALCFLAVSLLVYVIEILYKYRDKIIRWLRKIYYSYKKKAMIDSIGGFYGRDNVVKKIYTEYCSTKGVNTILICGLGGSGKTTIYTFFKQALVNSPKVEVLSKDISANSLRNRTILFVDYAYESVEKIKDLISSLKGMGKKKILIVLLERTDAIQYLKCLEYNCVINLNEEQYTLSEDDLSSIIVFNVANEYDKGKGLYAPTGISINNQKAKILARKIIDRIDAKHHRPIFAYIIADLYRSNPELDFDQTTSMYNLFEQYWQKKTRYHMTQRLVRSDDSLAERHRIETAVKNAKQLVELLTLFCSMTKLLIEYEKKTGVVLYGANSEVVSDTSLESYIESYFRRMLDDDIKIHLVAKILGTDLGKKYEGEVGSKLIICDICNFDIVSTWLLEKFYTESTEYTSELGRIIKNISNKNIEKAVISFILRSVDEDLKGILQWYCDIKDGFINYDSEDYIDILTSSFDKLNKTVHKGNYETAKEISNFLEELIKDIFDNMKQEDAEKIIEKMEAIWHESVFVAETNNLIKSLITDAKDKVEKGRERVRNE